MLQLPGNFELLSWLLLFATVFVTVVNQWTIHIYSNSKLESWSCWLQGTTQCIILSIGKASKRLLLELSEKMPNDWHRLGMYLGLDYECLVGIRGNEHLHSPDDKALEMLILWSKQSGNNATVDVLAGALKEVKRQDLVQWLQAQVRNTVAVIILPYGISCLA